MSFLGARAAKKRHRKIVFAMSRCPLLLFWRMPQPACAARALKNILFRVWAAPKTTWGKLFFIYVVFDCPGDPKNVIEKTFLLSLGGASPPFFWRMPQLACAARALNYIHARAWTALATT